MIDRDNQRLYELYRAFPQADGSVVRRHRRGLPPRQHDGPTDRQPGWTSADAAGLPILPGLVRYEEAARGAGGILHALRFTARAPARPTCRRRRTGVQQHRPDLPPMGRGCG